MKKISLILALAVALTGATSCGVTRTIKQLATIAQDSSSDKDAAMYYWGDSQTGFGVDYDAALAAYFNDGDKGSILSTYWGIMTNASEEASSKTWAPGFCAEVAYYLLKPETKAYVEKMVAEGKFKMKDGVTVEELARTTLEGEYANYPESRAIYEPIFKDLLK